MATQAENKARWITKMFRIVFISQITIYLIVMPIIRIGFEPFYRPPIAYGFLALISFGLGALTFRRRLFAKSSHVEVFGPQFIVRRHLFLFIFIAAVAYAFVVYTEGLFNRRQGSEVMAVIYGNLPIYKLAIIRLYEISIIPVLTIAFLNREDRFNLNSIAIGLIALMALPFMGVSESRGRLIVFALSFAVFFPPSTVLKSVLMNFKVLLGLSLSFLVFYIVSISRALQYGRINDYLYYEVVTRIDGLNLASELYGSGNLTAGGSWDGAMFSPFIAKIPFFEAGRIAKLSGITSTKQYYLRDILGTSRIDTSSSMILDPLYYAGTLGVIISFFILGVFIRKFDWYINRKDYFSSRFQLSCALTLVSAFIMIENDFFANVLTAIQNIAIIYLVIFFATARSKLPNRTTPQASMKTRNMS